jgi:hypothetical protein
MGIFGDIGDAVSDFVGGAADWFGEATSGFDWGGLLETGMSALGMGAKIWGADEQRDYSEKIAEINKEIYEEERKLIHESTMLELQKNRDDVHRIIGKQRVMYGASGVGFEGTPAEVIAETYENGLIDQAIIKKKGEVAEFRARKGLRIQEEKEDQADDLFNVQVGTSIIEAATEWDWLKKLM